MATGRTDVQGNRVIAFCGQGQQLLANRACEFFINGAKHRDRSGFKQLLLDDAAGSRLLIVFVFCHN